MDQMPRPPVRSMRGGSGHLLPTLALAGALLASGCSSGTSTGAPADIASSPPIPQGLRAGTGPRPAAGPARTVEQLAAAVGCKATFTAKAEDYHQAQCKTPEAAYVFLDFATAEGQRAWLDYPQMYGGVYLVGNRWILSAKSKASMQSPQKTLGGTIEESGSYGSSPSPQQS
ncbi:hypothetical protein [Actinacidiphila glaucinigra]|uniref:hypothetical protein n=1 Tax=Actinacidiphila glaucinigra TaxID=235986 RepID=UPI0035DBDDD2